MSLWTLLASLFRRKARPAPPVAPRFRAVAVIVTGVPHARVSLRPAGDAAIFIALADAHGRAFFPVVPEGQGLAVALAVESSSHEPYEALVVLRPGNQDLFIGYTTGQTFEPHQVVVKAERLRRRPHVLQVGPLRIEGRRFVRDTGEPFLWRGVTAFPLYLYWLTNRPRMHTMLADVLTLGGTVTGGKGPNLVRVLGNYDWRPWGKPSLLVADHGNRYYTQIPLFLDEIWTNYACRCEFTIIGDTEEFDADLARVGDHVRRVLHAIGTHPAAVVELVNEPAFRDGLRHGEARTLPDLSRPRAPLASGDYLQEPPLGGFRTLDYMTRHGERTPEWHRQMRRIGELYDAGITVPIVEDEPTRADPQGSNPDEWAWAAGTLALFTEGRGTFHCASGRDGVPLSPNEIACARQWFEALSFIPAGVSEWAYQRGDGQGGAGIGNIGLVDRGDNLRMYGRSNGTESYVVVIQPSASWRAEPRDRWNVGAQVGPQGCLIRLERDRWSHL